MLETNILDNVQKVIQPIMIEARGLEVQHPPVNPQTVHSFIP